MALTTDEMEMYLMFCGWDYYVAKIDTNCYTTGITYWHLCTEYSTPWLPIDKAYLYQRTVIEKIRSNINGL